MHSALLVGLLRAKIIGLLLKEAIALMMSSVKAPVIAATPVEMNDDTYLSPIVLIGTAGATFIYLQYMYTN